MPSPWHDSAKRERLPDTRHCVIDVYCRLSSTSCSCWRPTYHHIGRIVARELAFDIPSSSPSCAAIVRRIVWGGSCLRVPHSVRAPSADELRGAPCPSFHMRLVTAICHTLTAIYLFFSTHQPCRRATQTVSQQPGLHCIQVVCSEQ